MSLEDYLREIASILKDDYTSEFQKVLDLFNGDTALIGIDQERILVSVRDNQFQFSKPDETCEVGLVGFISRSLLFELLDGKTTLADAVLKSDCMIKGSPEAVLRFYNIVEILLKTSQTSPSFIELLNKFRYDLHI